MPGMPRWFLILNGVALLLMGLTMLSMRLRERPLYKQTFGLAWAVLCCAAGGTLLLMAQGHVTQPGTETPRPPQERTRGIEFPTGR